MSAFCIVHALTSPFLHYSAVLDHERIVFNYTDGAKCMHAPGHVPRNVILTLHCSQSASLESAPSFIREDPADCTYYMYWARPELCTTEKVSR